MGLRTSFHLEILKGMERKRRREITHVHLVLHHRHHVLLITSIHSPPISSVQKIPKSSILLFVNRDRSWLGLIYFQLDSLSLVRHLPRGLDLDFDIEACWDLVFGFGVGFEMEWMKRC